MIHYYQIIDVREGDAYHGYKNKIIGPLFYSSEEFEDGWNTSINLYNIDPIELISNGVSIDVVFGFWKVCIICVDDDIYSLVKTVGSEFDNYVFRFPTPYDIKEGADDAFSFYKKKFSGTLVYHLNPAGRLFGDTYCEKFNGVELAPLNF